MDNFPHFVPAWLIPLLGEREKRILMDPQTKMRATDQDETRLPPYQQSIESEEHGTFVICSRRKEIIS